MLAACLQSGVKEGRTRGKCWICTLARRTDRQGLPAPAPEHAVLEEKREERDMRQSRNVARRQRGEKERREAMRLSRTGFWQRGVGLPYGEVGGLPCLSFKWHEHVS